MSFLEAYRSSNPLLSGEAKSKFLFPVFGIHITHVNLKIHWFVALDPEINLTAVAAHALLCQLRPYIYFANAFLEST